MDYDSTEQKDDNPEQKPSADGFSCESSVIIKEEVDLPDSLQGINGEIEVFVLKTEPFDNTEDQDIYVDVESTSLTETLTDYNTLLQNSGEIKDSQIKNLTFHSSGLQEIDSSEIKGEPVISVDLDSCVFSDNQAGPSSSNAKNKPASRGKGKKCKEQPKSAIEKKSKNPEEKLFKCEKCQKSFSRKQNLLAHCKIHSKLKSYKCEECQKLFNLKSKLISHVKNQICVREYKCDECQKSFNRKDNLRSHIEGHLGIKPFQCDQCQKTFIRHIDLISHMNFHSGVRPFECEKCQKSFFRRKNLTSHMKIHSEVKAFKCDKCDKSFSYKWNLMSHIGRNHSEEKLHKCDICQKCFATEYLLKRHVKIHPSESAYPCSDCGAGFRRKKDLNLHLLELHGGTTEVFNCAECNKAFAKKYGLNLHVRRMHDIKKKMPE